ncbi:Fpg/Nei family DNA glycosylase [Microlunatus sp. GCM10028923]|uniref:Fpg/Nei family DNA glycosylase n=1 Tax=Microlunatus sp. GCM10028923 TaxID=3273400 RepID=UPI00360D3158
MPEGDTVWLACRRLHAALAGRPLVRAELRVPSLATADLVGRTVLEVVSRGKHQLFRFDDGRTLHSHLRMDGTWRISHAGRPPRGGPPHELRALLANADQVAAGYRLPVLELLPTDEEDRGVGHLGPDLLGPDWDLDEAVRRLGADPGRAIGEALLDQRNLAGLGTFYRAEICFLQGIQPRRPVADVPNLRRLVDRARRLIMANRERPEQTSTGDLRSGARSYVYGRAGQPCRRCRTMIKSEEFGPDGQERLSYWCPTCQP